MTTGLIIYLTGVLVEKNAPIQVLLYHSLVAIILSGFVMVFQWETPSLHSWIFLGIGSITNLIALYAFTRAFYYAPPQILGGLSYSLILISALIQWGYWQRPPDFKTFFGFAFILIAGYIIIYKQKVLNQL